MTFRHATHFFFYFQPSCTALAALVYYFFMVVFAWMTIEGVHHLLLTVVVWKTGLGKIKYYVVSSWGNPFTLHLHTTNNDIFRGKKIKRSGQVRSFVYRIQTVYEMQCVKRHQCSGGDIHYFVACCFESDS